MNILVAMPAGEVRDSFIPSDVRAQLEELGTVVWNEDGRNWTEDELAEHIAHIDVCVLGWGCPPVGEKALARADALRAVLHTGGSVAGYAAEAVYDRHIPVLSGNELYARSVAESVVAYALYLLRDIGRYNGELLRDGWSQPGWKNEGLLDQTVGLIGFGAVARWTARLLSAFGVKLFINADHVTPEEAASYGARQHRGRGGAGTGAGHRALQGGAGRLRGRAAAHGQPAADAPQRAAHAAHGRADDGSPAVRHARAARGAAQSAGGGRILSDDYA